MKQDIAGKRLLALDGLRGFAIILVFFSHIGFSQHEFSTQPLIYKLVFLSGSIGVAFLFVLSGFLMAFLYPQPSGAIDFLQKRYTRIFPLFLTASVALLLFKVTPGNLLFQTLIFLFLAIFVHVVWVYRIKRTTNAFKRALFLSFLFLQILVGVSYFLISQKVFVFDLSRIPNIHLLLTGLVNSTLTFFVGSSFPVLDGVYWSLAVEIIFYILYPIICVPIIAHLSTKKRHTKIILLAALIPFFFGLARLFERSLSFSIIHPEYFYNFVGGMTLGYLYRKYDLRALLLYKSFPKFISIGSIFLLIGAFLLAHVSGPFFNGLLEQILLAIPYSLVVAMLLLPETGLARIFSSKMLVYVGTVSYSIYLSHMWLKIAIMKIIGQPTTMVQLVAFNIFTLLLSILLASILYQLLERPYFMKGEAKEKKIVNFSYNPSNRALFAYLGIFGMYVIVALFAYRIDLPYNHLRDPYFKKIAASHSNNKWDSAVMEKEHASLTAEKRKTLLLLLPFFSLMCYLTYETKR